MNKNKFESEAEEFLNFDGSFGTNPDKMLGANDYYVGPYDMAGGGRGHDSYANDNLGSIDESDRTLTVNISNDGTSTNPVETARVFGAFTNVAGTQPTGVTVTILETSHEQVRAESQVNPFLILGLKYIVTNVAQFSNNCTVFSQTSAGMTLNKTFQPFSWRSAQNQIATQIDAPSYAFAVDGRTEWRVPINADEDVTFIFSLKTRGDITNILRGRGVVDMAKGVAPTGLPQMDIPRGAR